FKYLDELRKKHQFDYLNFTPTAKRIDPAPYEQLLSDLDHATRTSTENEVSAYEEKLQAIKLLNKEGVIDAVESAKRQAEALDQLLPEFQVTLTKMSQQHANRFNEIQQITE